MGMYTLNVCLCEVCRHAWLSLQRPARCAKCKSSKWNDAIVPTEQENYPPEPEITSEDAEAFMVDLQPKTRQSTASVTPIVKERTRIELPKPAKKKDKAARQAEKQEAKRKGKDGYCPHNFILLEGGVTACPQCK